MLALAPYWQQRNCTSSGRQRAPHRRKGNVLKIKVNFFIQL